MLQMASCMHIYATVLPARHLCKPLLCKLHRVHVFNAGTALSKIKEIPKILCRKPKRIPSHMMS